MPYSRQQFNANAAALAGISPDGARAFGALHQTALEPGELDRSTKELMALAISVATGCGDCCGHHLEQAQKAGASRRQVSETLEVAIMMGGGPAYTYAGTVASMLGPDDDD